MNLLKSDKPFHKIDEDEVKETQIRVLEVQVTALQQLREKEKEEKSREILQLRDDVQGLRSQMVVLQKVMDRLP